jgi:hypothetical protein
MLLLAHRFMKGVVGIGACVIDSFFACFFDLELAANN